MPSLLFAAFCGGTNRERAGVIDDEQTINLFRSTVEVQGAAKTAYLIGTPGLKPLFAPPKAGAGRGSFTQDGRHWTVISDALYEITVDPVTYTGITTIPDDGLPVHFASNGDLGRQLAISGGGVLTIVNLDTFVVTIPVLPFTHTPVMVGYMDGYFVLLEDDSTKFWFSALPSGGGGLVWDALDFVQRSTASDHFVGLAVANNRVWCFGGETSEAYENTGDADNPFQPIAGSLFQIGLAARYSLSIGINTLRWLGRSSRGGAVVYRMDGYGGTRISTHAIEATLAGGANLADAEALTYDQEGHLFYALTCPSVTVQGYIGWSPCWDETEQEWHTRAGWQSTTGDYIGWRVRGHAFIGATHVVGSRDGPQMYALDLETYTDDGAIIRAVRRAPYLGAEKDWVFLDEVELGIEAGVGLVTGQGSDPQYLLNLSKDGGKTWTSAGAGRLGAIGETLTRTFWTRLGRARLDRLVLEVVITDPVKRVLGPGLWIRATPGKAA